MKTQTIATVLLIGLLMGGAAFGQDADKTRPFIGIRLDAQPLPQLLAKHLGLAEQQGIRIQNVAKGLPADQAGLERDDIVIAFNGEDVLDREAFVNAVGEHSVADEVSLEVIHLGKRKTVRIKLAAWAEDAEWKYPPEPEASVSWHPGDVFMLKPEAKGWIKVPFEDFVVPDVDPYVKTFLRRVYVRHYSDADGDYTVTIEGRPEDEDTWVTVKTGDTEYKVTVKDLDELPEKHRRVVGEALDEFRKSKPEPHVNMQLAPPSRDYFQRYFKNVRPPQEWLDQKDEILQRIEKQMKQLRERIDGLEGKHKELLERLTERLKQPRRPDPDTSEDQDDPAA